MMVALAALMPVIAVTALVRLGRALWRARHGPDLASVLLASGVIALVWAIVRTMLAYGTLRKPVALRSVIAIAKA